MKTWINSIGERCGRRVDVLWFLLANALLIAGVYLAPAQTLLRTVKAHPTGEDWVLLACYTLAAALTAALGCFTVCLLVPDGRRGLWPRIPAVVAAGAALAATVVDVKVFAVLGLHLYDPLILGNLRNRHLDAELNLGGGTMFALGAFVAGCAVGQVLLAWTCARRRPAAAAARRAACSACTFWALAVLGPAAIVAGYLARPAMRHGSLALAVLPGYGPLFASRQAQRPLEVVYPALPDAPPTLQRQPDILLAVAESFRADVLGPDLTPHVWRFQNEHGTIHSAHHDAGCHVTEFGLFSLLYGLDAFHYSPFMQRQTQSLPLQLLKASGYELIGACAAPTAEWNYAEFMFDSFDEYREFHEREQYRSDQAMVEWLRSRLAQRRSGRPVLVFAFFNATHHNYHYPPQFERFRPVFPESHNYFVETGQLAESRLEIFNRYKNSVGYVDHLFGQLLGAFTDQAAGREQIVLFTGDHGEEFWEHDLLGHSATRFINERTQVPLVLSLPGCAARQVALSCHADVMPTILDLVGLAGSPPVADFTSGLSLLQPQPDQRHIVISGAGFPFGNDLLCIMTSDRKHWLRKTASRLGDLQRVFVTDGRDQPAPEDPAAAQPACVDQARLNMYRFLREEL